MRYLKNFFLLGQLLNLLLTTVEEPILLGIIGKKVTKAVLVVDHKSVYFYIRPYN